MIALFAACFFLSGFSSLVYQTLWTRTLSHEIGGSPYAVAIILSVFMGGLGLGAILGGRLADKLKSSGRLIFAYGVLESAVGLYALILPGALRALRPSFSAIYSLLYGNSFLYHVAVFILCALVLSPPILAMGATLPLIGRHMVRNLDRVGGSLGYLYGINTLGAALGVASAGFWLIPVTGIKGATWTAASINTGVGIICLLIWALAYRSRKTGNSVDRESRKSPSADGPDRERGRHPRFPDGTLPGLAALAAFALSGYCAMAYEVIWTKILSLLMGPTTYAFTTVLVTFIGGLALGGWACGRLADRSRNPALLLAVTQLGAALFALAAGHRMGNSLLLFEKIDYAYHGNFGVSVLLKGLFLFAFMMPTTFLLGSAFPLVMRIFARTGDKMGRSIGYAYALNTAGGVLGAWTAGFLLVPYLGSERSLGMLAALQALGGGCLGFLALSFRAGPNSRAFRGNRSSSARSRLALGSAALFTLALATGYPSWDREALGRAAARPLGPELAEVSWLRAVWESIPRRRAPLPEAQVYYGDGLGGFTSVWRSEDVLGGHEFSLYVSGKADASSRRDMFTQALLAHVPMILHPNPLTVMVLGLASGVTAGEVLRYPIERMDVLEINPQVVEASRFFESVNGRPLADSRARLILQDAKAHLLLARDQYDVIISEPSNPWMAGLSELFSLEFFTRARERLGEDGIMVQFLHSYSMDWEAFSLVGRTFSQVFPNSQLVRTLPDDRRMPGQASDYLLVGRKNDRPLRFLPDSAKYRALASSRNIRLPDVRLLGRLVEAENLRELFGAGPLHTDNHPVLEFAAPKLRFLTDSRPIEEAIALRGRVHQDLSLLVDSLRTDTAARMAYADFALSLYKPFPGMLGPEDVPEQGRDVMSGTLENFCASNHLLELDFVTDPDLRMKCSIVQMAVLNRRLQSADAPAAPILLAMAELCLMNGALPNAVRFLSQAASASEPTSPIGSRARALLDQVRASSP